MQISNEQFRKIRKVYQLTTTELAEVLGYSQTYISAMERGAEVVSDNVRRRMEHKLGLNPIKLREIESTFDRFKVK